MVIRQLRSDSNVPSGTSTIWDRLRAGSESSPNSPLLTPSTTTFVFSEQRVTSPSSDFGGQITSDRTSSASHPTTSRTPRFTRSHSTLQFTDNSTFSLSSDHDPDRPLPSIERDDSPTASHRNTPSTTSYTPSTSTDRTPALLASDQDADIQQINELSNLRLASPEAIPSERRPRTPSIHVTPSAQLNEMNRPPPSRTDSLVAAVDALRVVSPRAETPRASGSRERHSPSPSPTPSPSGRSRSPSGTMKRIYRVEDEETPEALAQMPEVQTALATAKSLTASMVSVLSSSSIHLESGSSIEDLQRQAVKLSNFQLPSSRIVGLVGDSGVGKSSLINSLLDKVDLARTSGSGTACTCAVTEYVFHERNDFIIDIDYFPLEELKKQVEELLDAYRDYHSRSKSSRDQEDAEDDNEKQRLRKKARLATETFKASFGDRLDQEPGVLSTMPIGLAVGRMVEWASQLLPQQMLQESFGTLEGCAARLRELTSESDKSSNSRQPRTCWPFIRKICVHLNAYILSKGLIIADLPGLRDHNSARKAMTERYIRECHHIFVVARIDRAVTDASIKEIFELANRANLSRIDVICTRSEDVQPSEARHDWPAERATIDEIQSNIDAAIHMISDLDADLEDYDLDDSSLNREEKEKLSNLWQEHRKAKKTKEQLEFEQKRHIISLRNDKVSRGLRNQYRDHPMTSALRIFCVSNNLYRDNRKKPVESATPCLQLSGIIELRRYCTGLMAQSRLRATRDFIKDEIPAFLGSVELWIEAGSGNASAVRKQQTLDTVSAMQRKLNQLTSSVSPMRNLSRDMLRAFNSQILLRMSQSERTWAGAAKDASMYWEGWNSSTYKVFCSKYGDHRTRLVGPHCWNKEAIKGMREDMTTPWDSLKLDLEAHREQVRRAVVANFSDLHTLALSVEGPECGITDDYAMHTLADIIHHREDLALSGFREADKCFVSDLLSFETDAFSSVDTAFIGKRMADTYHAANMDSGPRSDQRRKKLITGRFGSEILFNDHRNDCEEKFREITQALQEKVSALLIQQAKLVGTSLRMLRDNNVILESERDPEFRRRVGAEVRSVRAEVNRIGSMVESAS